MEFPLRKRVPGRGTSAEGRLLRRIFEKYLAQKRAEHPDIRVTQSYIGTVVMGWRSRATLTKKLDLSTPWQFGEVVRLADALAMGGEDRAKFFACAGVGVEPSEELLESLAHTEALGPDERPPDMSTKSQREAIDEGDRLIGFAEAALKNGSPRVALARLDEAEGLRLDGLPKARALWLKGQALIQMVRSREAIRLLEKAHRSLRDCGRPDLAAEAQFDLARALTRLALLPGALVVAGASAQQFEETAVQDASKRADVEVFLASICVALNDSVSALEHSARAQALVEYINEPKGRASVYRGISRVRFAAGDLKAALNYARMCLDIYEEAGEVSSILYALLAIANIYVFRRQFTRADETLTRAEAFAGTRPDSLARVDLLRATLELAKGEPRSAVSAAERAQRMARDARDSTNALLLKAIALSRTRAPLKEVKAAFSSAVSASARYSHEMVVRAHNEYAAALAWRGQSALAYREAARAQEGGPLDTRRIDGLL